MCYPDKEIAFLLRCFYDDDSLLRGQVYSHALNCHLYHVYLTLSFVPVSVEFLTPLLYTYQRVWRKSYCTLFFARLMSCPIIKGRICGSITNASHCCK